MTTAAVGIVRIWSCGRYTCTLTVQRPRKGEVLSCSVEWSPEQPRRLTEDEIAEYRQGRNQAMAEISRELGISAAVMEV